jgi:hypothetical protein
MVKWIGGLSLRSEPTLRKLQLRALNERNGEAVQCAVEF